MEVCRVPVVWEMVFVSWLWYWGDVRRGDEVCVSVVLSDGDVAC